MLWELERRYKLEKTDSSELFGKIHNCFVYMYEDYVMKIVELYVPEIDESDKDYVREKLSSNRTIKYMWIENGIKISFISPPSTYPISSIKMVLDDLTEYFNNKYPEKEYNQSKEFTLQEKYPKRKIDYEEKEICLLERENKSGFFIRQEFKALRKDIHSLNVFDESKNIGASG